MWYDGTVDPKRPYHHGGLRRTLLDAALALIAEAGPQGFTLREVARRAGVSHNAPYRHFRDKDELLAAVATEGFDKLTRRIQRATSRAADPLARFQQSGLGYVEFALASPQHYTVMFDVRESGPASSDLAAASARAFGTLIAAVEECRSAGVVACENTMSGALYAWALAHGIAKLAIAGRLPWRSRAAILRFAASVFEQSYRGMAPRPAGVTITKRGGRLQGHAASEAVKESAPHPKKSQAAGSPGGPGERLGLYM
jgi:AcrR family transcriptional regulator